MVVIPFPLSWHWCSSVPIVDNQKDHLNQSMLSYKPCFVNLLPLVREMPVLVQKQEGECLSLSGNEETES